MLLTPHRRLLQFWLPAFAGSVLKFILGPILRWTQLNFGDCRKTFKPRKINPQQIWCWFHLPSRGVMCRVFKGVPITKKIRLIFLEYLLNWTRYSHKIQKLKRFKVFWSFIIWDPRLTACPFGLVPTESEYRGEFCGFNNIVGWVTSIFLSKDIDRLLTRVTRSVFR